MSKKFTSKQFREELTKVLPGYKWTVHRPSKLIDYPGHSALRATGTQSSGFNRLSTICVTIRMENDFVEYDVRSAGFGANTKWLSDYQAHTLKQALRGLQSFYETMSSIYLQHANHIRLARKGDGK